MEGELDGFDYGSKLGRTGFIAQPPLVVEGNRVLIDPSLGGIITDITSGDGITIINNNGSTTIINNGVIGTTGGDGITVDNTDPHNPIIINDGVISVVAGSAIGVNSADPQHPIVTNNGVRSLVQGANVTIDNTDPRNPIISASGSGTSGVDSWSGGTTGMTPAIATSGAVTMAGVLATTNGGTGQTGPYSNGQILIGNSSTGLLDVNSVTINEPLEYTTTPGNIIITPRTFGFRAVLTGNSNNAASGATISTNWSATLYGSVLYPGAFASGIFTPAISGLYQISWTAYSLADQAVVACVVNNGGGDVDIMCSSGIAAIGAASQPGGSLMYPLVAGGSLRLVNRSSGSKTFTNAESVSGSTAASWFSCFMVATQ